MTPPVRPVLAVPEDLAPREAVALQRELAGRVRLADDPGGLPAAALLAAVDCSVRGARARAAIVLVDLSTGAVIEQVAVERPLRFPYVPGLLAFREAPPLLDAFERLATRPDVLLCDGHGLAHPRRFGIACHLGVVLDLPSIGCGKSRLVGEFREPGERRGASTRLLDRARGAARRQVIGRVLRTRTGVRPVFVSVGHRVSLATAERLVLRLARPFRLPEPIRAADALAGRWGEALAP